MIERRSLFGENNTGKTSFLDAVRFCLERLRSRRNNVNPFDAYDYHLPEKQSQPGEAGSLSIELDFAEEQSYEWSDELVQSINDILTLDVVNDIRHVILRVTSHYNTIGELMTDWEFLNIDRTGLVSSKSKTPQALATLQRICPIFYLSAVRDSVREFSPRSSFWGPFLRNPSIDPDVRQQLEQELNELNTKIIGTHTNLQKVRDKLAKTQEVVTLGKTDPVSIEALPGRIIDMLTHTQVNMTASTGVSLPLERHGAGTQSLSVIFLFEAFIHSILAETYDTLSSPILALEEPEAHLHPTAIRFLAKILDSIAGQKIIATHSGDLLSRIDLLQVRRFRRSGGAIEVRQVQPSTLTPDEQRKIDFHLRSNRGALLCS